MKYNFSFKCKTCFSKLITIFLFIMYNYLIGQSAATDIVRDEKGNFFSIKYYSKVSKNLELLKLETFYPNRHVAMLELFSSGVKNGVHKEFFNNGNKKSKGAVFFGGKKEERCWDRYGNTRNCIKGG